MKCTICGVELKFLNAHLKNRHQLNAKDYYDLYLKKT